MTNIIDSYARDLDLNLLRVFVVVAEEGSLTRAAARLYVTQPAVSASMRRLAAFLGAELVVRQATESRSRRVAPNCSRRLESIFGRSSRRR